jgi:hypothetical protein
MGKIDRDSLPNTIVTLFLDVFRNNLSDVCSPKRTNTKWIRSDLQYNKTKLNQSTSSKGKIRISKPKAHVGFPQVVVSNYQETNDEYVINDKMLTEGSVTVRVVDISTPQRIDSLAASIGNLLKTKKSTLISNGLSKITWDITPVNEFGFDDNMYNEKDILINFRVRVSDGC